MIPAGTLVVPSKTPAMTGRSWTLKVISRSASGIGIPWSRVPVPAGG